MFSGNKKKTHFNPSCYVRNMDTLIVVPVGIDKPDINDNNGFCKHLILICFGLNISKDASNCLWI